MHEHRSALVCDAVSRDVEQLDGLVAFERERKRARPAILNAVVADVELFEG